MSQATPRATIEFLARPDIKVNLLRFRGVEGLSMPSETHVTILADEPIDIDELRTTTAVVRLGPDADGDAGRYFTGRVTEATDHGDIHGRGAGLPGAVALFAGQHKFLYDISIRARLWYLARGRNIRIFQDKTVRTIIGEVLVSSGLFAADEFEYVLFDESHANYAREYCVQYHESDLGFVSRLLEDEGIYYYVDQGAAGTRYILSDHNVGYRPAGDRVIRYQQAAGQWMDEERAVEFATRVAVLPDRVTLRHYDYARPHLLEVQQQSKRRGSGVEFYEDSEPIELGLTAGHRARTVIEAFDSQAAEAIGRGNIMWLKAGSQFKLIDRYETPRNFVVTRMEYVCEQAIGAGDEAAAANYTVTFTCIPANVVFRPPPQPRPFAYGVQTAFVVGEGEIRTDKLARLKVKFHWDRRDDGDDTTAWVRCAQGWAGSQYGIQFLPRVGHEVLVAFARGNPDKPIIIASLYGGTNLPTDPTVSDVNPVGGIRTKSIGIDSGRYHELMFDDSPNDEEVSLRVENQWTVWVTGDHAEEIEGDQTIDVAGDHRMTVGGDQLLSVEGGRTHMVGGSETMSVTGNQLLYVTANRQTSIAGSRVAVVGGDETLSVVGDDARIVDGAANHSIGGTFDFAVTGATSEIYLASRQVSVGADETKTVAGTQQTSAADIDIQARDSISLTSDTIAFSGATSMISQTPSFVVQADSQVLLSVDDNTYIKIDKDAGTIEIQAGGQSMTFGTDGITMSGTTLDKNFSETIDLN